MVGSTNMFGRDVTFTIKVGDRKTLIITITNQQGVATNLSNTTTFSTARWKVWKPDGTLLIDGAATYSDRANGQISYALVATDTAIENAGNWVGEVEMFNDSAISSDQSETFNFNIIESY